MRCDLHVHTKHSGMCTLPLLRRVCRESYNDPLEVYETLKRSGMDLVTITDHDSIGAVETLRGKPDFFLSEEVTCTLPSGTELHVGVYDITERDHIEMQRRRHDFESLFAWLFDNNLFFSANQGGISGPCAPTLTRFPVHGSNPVADTLYVTSWGPAPLGAQFPVC